jgi:tetratricopeptide (TPR) repeat protein
MIHKIWLILLVSLFPLWLVQGQPKDPNVEKAKALFNAATVYYNDKDYEKALAGYQDAYKVAPLPVILFNIAQCYRFLNRNQEAIDAYQKFLRDDPQTPYQKEVMLKIKDLEVIVAAEKEAARLAQEREALLAQEREALLAQEATSQAASQATSTPTSGPLSAPGKDPKLNPKLLFAAPAVFGAVGLGLGISALSTHKRLQQSGEGITAEQTRQHRVRFALTDGFLVSAAVSGVVIQQLVTKLDTKISSTKIQPPTGSLRIVGAP